MERDRRQPCRRIRRHRALKRPIDLKRVLRALPRAGPALSGLDIDYTSSTKRPRRERSGARARQELATIKPSHNPKGCRTHASKAPLMRDLHIVPGSRRATLIAVAAAAVAVAVAVLVLAGPLAASGKGACSSYAAAGGPAPAGAKVTASLAARYSVLRDPQRPADRLSPRQVGALSEAGVIMSGVRLLGDAPFGGRAYLVPAEHLVALVPPRCLRPTQRMIQQEALPVLRREYRHPGVCLYVLYRNSNARLVSCAPVTGNPDALLTTNATPALGLVPNGVSAVTVTFVDGPPQTLAVHRNFYVTAGSTHAPLPCGVQWLDPTGNVKKVVYGCSYLKPETQELRAYRTYVTGKLATLRSQTAALATAVGSGNIGEAKSAWLTAHLTWLDIGQDDGAYGCFGALGGKIDGLAAGHPLGTADPGFTGFHRIEFDLWTKHSLAAAASDTATLQRLVARLIKTPLTRYLPATPTSIGNWLLRPHEVLEDALRDSLTANDNYGSGTDLASITADVTAVRKLLSEIRPGLYALAPGLFQRATGELDALTGAINATRVHGGWVSIERLPVRQRQQVDADVDAALETLAPIPDLLTSTGHNAPVS